MRNFAPKAQSCPRNRRRTSSPSTLSSSHPYTARLLGRALPGSRLSFPLNVCPGKAQSDLEQAWELTGGSEDQLTGTMMQISHVVAQQFNKPE